jgi:uncharacterized membrane protein YeaQ/YmgE (transglycosylase-associated protein family)
MKIAQFFQDGTGAYSATRLGFVLWVIGVLVAWIAVSITNHKLEHIDNSVVAIIGVLMSGKVVQSFSENMGTQNPTTNDQTQAGDIPALPPAQK